jgi:hypothetical protein
MMVRLIGKPRTIGAMRKVEAENSTGCLYLQATILIPFIYNELCDVLMRALRVFLVSAYLALYSQELRVYRPLPSIPAISLKSSSTSVMPMLSASL